MTEPQPTAAGLARANEELRAQLEEAHDLIDAIRTGAVDALAVQGADGPRIFTLQGADQSYRNLIEQMNEGALLLSENGTVLYCNASLARLLGRPLAEVIGSALSRVVPAAYQAAWAELLLQSWRGRSRGELPLLTQSGALMPFSMSLNVLKYNAMPALAVIVTDLSAQREIEAIRARVAEQNAQLDQKTEALKREETARRAGEQSAAEAIRMLEGIPQIAWTASPQGYNTYLNSRWADYAGRQPGLPREQWLAAAVHPADLPAASSSWQQCLATGEPLEIQCRLRNAAGAYRWMLGRALPSRNEQDEIIQWIGTYTDIHEYKLALERIDEAQHELRHNNEQLTRVNADLDNFIYVASHDLKAPINNIEGLLSVLLQELPATPAQSPAVQHVLALMQDSVNRFKRTIEHLTEVSKLQKEHAPASAPVDLAAVIRDVQLDLAPLIRSTGAALEFDVQTAPWVSFSEKNLRSVVFNLLSNALKYHDPARAPQVRLSARPEADGVLLEVQDNGLGLAAAHQRQLFGMFQRFHNHVEGSGIGLYMVKKMVENAGGRITVNSELGRGTTFWVYFTP